MLSGTCKGYYRIFHSFRLPQHTKMSSDLVRHPLTQPHYAHVQTLGIQRQWGRCNGIIILYHPWTLLSYQATAILPFLAEILMAQQVCALFPVHSAFQIPHY